jgi:hypothetical protein
VLLIDYSIGRLDAALEEIKRIEESDFPYGQSQDALARIRQLFEEYRGKIRALPRDKSPDIVKALCGEVLTALFRYLPLLGFILRSTNVRNAFEIYGPLLRLSQKILRGDTKLILSSEWRMYSPFTYLRIPALPDFVLIGFPAPESANPLLVPLAGHELGHTVWSSNNYGSKYKNLIEQRIIDDIEKRSDDYQKLFPIDNLKSGEAETNIFVRQRIALASAWALRQAEEYFCDFLGLYLFDEAYLHAFAYLISPSPGGERAVFYPKVKNRVARMIEASKEYNKLSPDSYNVPDGFSDLFQDESEPAASEREKKFFLELADPASSSVISALIEEARTIVSASSIAPVTKDEKKHVLDSFKFVVPPQNAQLSSIVNAAWEVYHKDAFWSEIPPELKNSTLKELTLKSIEVLEIEFITTSSV